MVETSYVVRRIDAGDREKHRRMVSGARDRGDNEDADLYEASFAKWESEQGLSECRMSCSVCQDAFLSPTRDGRARRHRRWRTEGPTWDEVRWLMKQIQVLQAELDTALRALEPPD